MRERPTAPMMDGGYDRTDPPDERRLARIRWRCRRGMLENDLVLARYLDARGGALTAGQAEMLDRLLDLPDQALWDLIARRADPADPGILPLVEALREIRLERTTE
jgi:antitoxin CptB